MAKTADVPGLLLSSDHLSFRLKGLANSVTLSLLPAEELPVLEHFVASLNIPGLLTRRKPAMPGVLSRVHRESDVSSQISEDSLKLMLSLLAGIIEGYNLRKPVRQEAIA